LAVTVAFRPSVRAESSLASARILVTRSAPTETFYGWRVVGGAFVLAVFGWGIGFYGPPIYLQAVHEARGWPLALVSTAVTTHFVIGALVVASLPALYGRFGVAAVTKGGSLLLALGILGWSVAAAPWQLFVATLASGAGWAALGAAAINAIVSPWFVRLRPAALATAYNGASIGGVIFSPLWVAAIAVLGFPVAAATVGLITVASIWFLADLLFSRTPQQLELAPDGDALGAVLAAEPDARLPPRLLWRDRKLATLCAGMALGLFAQIGTIAHLFSLLVPAVGAELAGLAMGLAPATAIAGRTLVGWLMPGRADRRLVACASYAVQIAGALAFIAAAGTSVPLLILGVVLFGAGIGNATSLPPLIAQVEFATSDVPRVVALVIAVAQGAYAFAPASFSLIREFSPSASGDAAFYGAVALVQALAIVAFLAGRRASLR
jgi:Major Facilitator Superfamily